VSRLSRTARWSIAWILWIAAFFALELTAIRDTRKGDTFSEKTRIWYHTGSTAGRWAFIVSLGTLFAWYANHILH
jgi:hypothetical protein